MPRIQHKRGTSANLASVNPTPLAGELVWDSTENAIKIGDGATAWASLAYVTATPRSHNHDDRYYTETEVDSFLAGKSDTGHNHGLSTLSDVSAAAPISDKAFLFYNSSLSQWVASTGIGQVGVGSQPLGGWPAGSVGAELADKVDTSDARLTDARTPTAHKATHATGGSDALTPSDIGAAPAASPTFTGVITVSATSGSAGSYAPSLTFSGDPNTGFGQVSGQSDSASVFTAGFERVRVDASGNVGISRTTPTVPLTFSNAVASPTTPSKDQQTNKVRLYDDGTYQFGFGISTGSLNIAANGGNLATMRFWTDSVERMRITAAGLIGIGTTSPSALLDINSDTIRLRAAKTPASASDTGNAGDICWDASYLYICTATNTWRRIAHATW